MRHEDYVDLYELEDTFWWFSGMRQLTGAVLDPVLAGRESLSVLDVGCGTGGMISWLARYSQPRTVTGVDISETAVSFCRRRNHDQIALASATRLPFSSSSFDLTTSFDVLVQLAGAEADRAAIGEMFRVLRPGGLAFVRVAAYAWMRGSHDETIRTQRRYTLGQLTEGMEAAGFRILRRSYANMFLLPIAIGWRLFLQPLGVGARGSDVKPLPRQLKWLNLILETALAAEAVLLQHLPKLPCGLSAICVGVKPDTKTD